MSEQQDGASDGDKQAAALGAYRAAKTLDEARAAYERMIELRMPRSYGEIGDNNPPPDEDPLLLINPEKLFVTDKITALLELHYKALDERADELLAQIEGWIVDHTAPSKPGDKPVKPLVGDEQDLADATDFINQVKDFLKDEVEVTRKKIKGPIDSVGALVQKHFVKGMADPLKEALIPIVDAQSIALREKLERERLRLREEAWAKAQEANRLAIDSAKATGVRKRESLLQEAYKVEAEVEELTKKAEGSALDLTRTRTDLGQVTGLRSTWEFNVENLIDLLIAIVSGRQDLLACVMVNEVHVNSLIKRKDGVRSIPGLHIFEDMKPR